MRRVLDAKKKRQDSQLLELSRYYNDLAIASLSADKGKISDMIQSLEKEIRTLSQEIDNAEEEIRSPSHRSVPARLSKPWRPYLHKIDYDPAQEVFRQLLKHHAESHSGMALLVSNAKQMGGQWCIEMLSHVLKEEWAPYLNSFRVTLDLSRGVRADSFLSGLGSHLGLSPLQSGDVDALDTAVQEIARRLCQRAQTHIEEIDAGAVAFLIDLNLVPPKDLPKDFLSWLCKQFWEPLLTKYWCDFAQNRPLSLLLLVIRVEKLLPSPLPANVFCTETDFDPARILELPLRNWSEKEITNWLFRFSGRSVPGGWTPAEIREIARAIFIHSEQGIPELVYSDFIQLLPRENRATL